MGIDDKDTDFCYCLVCDMNIEMHNELKKEEHKKKQQKSISIQKSVEFSKHLDHKASLSSLHLRRANSQGVLFSSRESIIRSASDLIKESDLDSDSYDDKHNYEKSMSSEHDMSAEERDIVRDPNMLHVNKRENRLR